MTYVTSFPGRKITVGASKKLYFGGTAYLGLQQHKQFLKVYIDNINMAPIMEPQENLILKYLFTMKPKNT